MTAVAHVRITGAERISVRPVAPEFQHSIGQVSIGLDEQHVFLTDTAARTLLNQLVEHFATGEDDETPVGEIGADSLLLMHQQAAADAWDIHEGRI